MCFAKSLLTVNTTETSFLNLDTLQQLLPSRAWVNTVGIFEIQDFPEL